jgi:2,3-bisphosphoglycerate-independent phosphoglycerate mutase
MPRVLLLFVDGVGLGDDAAWNPFLSASLPNLAELLDGLPVIGSTAPYHGSRASLVGIDAGLGVSGTPQSGTGQATLLTGANAAVMHGRHFGPWVPAQLQQRVREESILARASAAGRSVAFANAYPEEVLELAGAGRAAGVTPASAEAAPQGRSRVRRRAPAFLRAGPPLAALGAGVLDRHTAELARGDAVASEITNEGWRTGLGRTHLPVIDAPTAGYNLARIAAAHDFTLFAHYATDYAGHRRVMDDARQALERLDAFIGGVVAHMTTDTLLFVVSDHGNIEDIRTGHTRNAAIGLVAGRGHALLARRLGSLMDVAPTILDVLELEPGAGAGS